MMPLSENTFGIRYNTGIGSGPGLLILLQPGDEKLGGIAFNTDLRSKSNNGNVGAHLCVRPLGGTRRSPPYKMVSFDRNDITVNLSPATTAFMLAAKPEGVDENIKVGFPGEEGNPLDHREGDEVGNAWFSDGIAASHGTWGL